MRFVSIADPAVLAIPIRENGDPLVKIARYPELFAAPAEGREASIRTLWPSLATREAPTSKLVGASLFGGHCRAVVLTKVAYADLPAGFTTPKVRFCKPGTGTMPETLNLWL